MRIPVAKLTRNNNRLVHSSEEDPNRHRKDLGTQVSVISPHKIEIARFMWV